ncbi:MAG TPA: hypothetical protein VIH17_03045 [Candidatus Acidoferrales bacterium]
MAERSTIFISCGQVTEEEKELGTAVCKLVRELTSCEPYFAENQSSLEGLTKNILGALNRCAGLIVIMHPRGIVTFPDGHQHTRASIWIEQEIAIAAFLTQVLGRDLRVAAYIHTDIAREGMRDKLQLNPTLFQSSGEVLGHLRRTLRIWGQLGPVSISPLQIALDYQEVKITGEQHDYQLVVTLTNSGLTKIQDYQVDVFFPDGFLNQHQQLWYRSTRPQNFHAPPI